MKLKALLIATTFLAFNSQASVRGGCQSSDLIKAGVLSHNSANATIEFTSSHMIITQSNGVAATRQWADYDTYGTSIEYTIVKAKGSSKSGMATLQDSDFDGPIPIRNAGPHDVPCGFENGTLYFGNGTYSAW